MERERAAVDALGPLLHVSRSARAAEPREDGGEQLVDDALEIPGELAIDRELDGAAWPLRVEREAVVERGHRRDRLRPPRLRFAQAFLPGGDLLRGELRVGGVEDQPEAAVRRHRAEAEPEVQVREDVGLRGQALRHALWKGWGTAWSASLTSHNPMATKSVRASPRHHPSWSGASLGAAVRRGSTTAWEAGSAMRMKLRSTVTIHVPAGLQSSGEIIVSSWDRRPPTSRSAPCKSRAR